MGLNVIILIIVSASVAVSSLNIDSTLWDQGINDFDFHGDCIRNELFKVGCQGFNCTAVVVGVEKGNDVIQMAEVGMKVIGVEPVPEFATFVLNRAVENNLLSRVSVMLGAAGSVAAQVNITYQNHNFEILSFPLDAFIEEEIGIVSIDVHGDATPLDVVLGARKAIARGLIRSLWVELKPTDWAQELLEFLSEDYLLFDFIWVGTPISCRGTPAYLCNKQLVYAGPRPQPDNYIETMFSVKAESFQWMQTDIIALHRSVVTDSVIEQLNTMSTRCNFGRRG